MKRQHFFIIDALEEGTVTSNQFPPNSLFTFHKDPAMPDDFSDFDAVCVFANNQMSELPSCLMAIRKVAPFVPIFLCVSHFSTTLFTQIQQYNIDCIFGKNPDFNTIETLLESRVGLDPAKKKEQAMSSGFWSWAKRILCPAEPVFGIMPPMFQTKNKSQSTTLYIQMFGGLTVFVDGKPIKVKLAKQNIKALAFILMQYPKPVLVSTLLERLWEGHSPDAAKNCLNVAIHSIRTWAKNELGLSSQFLCYENGRYRLDAALLVETDLNVFQKGYVEGMQLWRKGEVEPALKAWEVVHALYKGQLLGAFHSEAWIESEAWQLQNQSIKMLSCLTKWFLNESDYETVIDLTAKILYEDACLQEIWEIQILAQLALGRLGLATQTMKRAELRLKECLNIGLSSRFKAFFEENKGAEPKRIQILIKDYMNNNSVLSDS